MARRHPISETEIATIQERLRYDPETGDFFWNEGNGSGGPWAVKAGQKAGCASGKGYWVIRFGPKLFFAHRLAFILMTGSCPDEIDHINLDGMDNRWSNLRIADRSQNNRNRRKGRLTKESPKGAYFDQRRGRWYSSIRINGTNKHLGYFQTAEDAHQAWITAASMEYGQFVRSS